ncbi:MAG TPA: tryptophan--tRNA ligase [Thermoanaerobaculaceae bacterium]|nr:tryptophan--tRNA ligase [Thermoanaerobaculaceae bacterium]
MRILSGVQPSGKLHIGNYFGAIRQFVQLQADAANDCYYFVADLHAMTTIKDGAVLRDNTFRVAADFIALGLDPERSVLYRQSDVPEVAELAWMLSTVTPMGLLQRGHSYKDKVAKGITPNHGLFAYPVLMAADILIVRADRVPVGRDQKQHLEMTRDIAAAFNQTYGQDVLRVPEELILPEVAVVPGVDGQKMSKSYGNTLEIFAPEAELKKRVMSIVTDSTPVADPKPTRGNALYAMLKVFTPEDAWPETKRLFVEGGTGYGELKKRLLGLILDTFRDARARRDRLDRDRGYVESALRDGCERAREVISSVMADCRHAGGLGW